jgi:hypothetical protein
MAKDDKTFDQFFKDKLVNHEEKISGLAWEKLEAKLPAENKVGGFPWMKIAASLTLILGVGYLILNYMGSEEPSLSTSLATYTEEELEIKEEQLKETSTSEASQMILESAPFATPSRQKEAVAKDSDNGKKTSNIRLPKHEEVEIKQIIASIPEKIEVSLPEIILDLPSSSAPSTKDLIAVAKEDNSTGEVQYSIKIISKGIKEEPQKPAIINEIENKIDKVGNWLGKVDQGFAELQDAKDNLFASITTKSDKKQK